MEVRFRIAATGETVLVNPKETAISVTLDGIPVYAFDREGRLLTVFDGTRTWIRGLDDRVLEKQVITGPGGRRKLRRPVPEAERRAGLGPWLERIHRAHAAVETGGATVIPPASPEAVAAATAALARVAAWDLDALAADGRRFTAIYGRVSILPPDQYFAVVLQATVGCPFNRCTFCTFYRGQPFRVRTLDEFRAHLRAVRAFFGEGLRLRRSVFLGDANALVAPQDRLLAFLDLAAEAFPRLGRVSSFLDVFSAEKSAAEFAALAARGLGRVYLGVESGHDPLLRFLGKPGSAARTRRMVGAAKAGGVGVGIILLIGAGGHRYAAAHVEDTIRLLTELPLDAHDVVYGSPLVTAADSAYAARARAAGVTALTDEEMAGQEAALRAGLGRRPGPAPRWVRYDVREFVY